MKKILLATTAVVGVAFLAQTAVAEGLSVSGGVKFKLSITQPLGEVQGGKTVIADGETVNATNDEVVNSDALALKAGFGVDSYELAFKGSKELESGLTASMVAEYNLGTSSRSKYYGALAGGFGQVRFGNVASAADSLVVGNDYDGGEAPTIGSSGTSTERATAGTVGIHGDSGEGDVKLVYLSPSFSGAEFGLSYALSNTQYEIAESKAAVPAKAGVAAVAAVAAVDADVTVSPNVVAVAAVDAVAAVPAVDAQAATTGISTNGLSHKIGVGLRYGVDLGASGSLKTGLGFAVAMTPVFAEEKPKDAPYNKIDMGLQVGAAYSISGATIDVAFSMDLPAAQQDKAQKVADDAKYVSSSAMAVGSSIGYNFGAGTVKAGLNYGLHGNASVIIGSLGVGYTIVQGLSTNLDIAYSTVSNGLDTTNENSKSALGVALSTGVSF